MEQEQLVALSQGQANEDLVRRWFEEVWNRQNASAIDEILTPDCVAYGLPDPDAVLRGPEAFKQVHAEFCDAFPDIQIEVNDVIAAGDRVAARWRATGTHSGDGLGFAPTGKRIVLDGATIVVIRDGRMQEGWNMMDMGHLFCSLRGDGSRF
jgi:steroid delta-isomerase-like uncharacterized protein